MRHRRKTNVTTTIIYTSNECRSLSLCFRKLPHSLRRTVRKHFQLACLPNALRIQHYKDRKYFHTNKQHPRRGYCKVFSAESAALLFPTTDYPAAGSGKSPGTQRIPSGGVRVVQRTTARSAASTGTPRHGMDIPAGITRVWMRFSEIPEKANAKDPPFPSYRKQKTGRSIAPFGRFRQNNPGIPTGSRYKYR